MKKPNVKSFAAVFLMASACGCKYTPATPSPRTKGFDDALELAWQRKDYAELQRLLTSRTTPYGESRRQDALFISAVKQGSPEQLELFLSAGADVNKPYQRGYTSLMYAVMAGNASNVKCLLSHGADPNLLTQEGSSSLDLAEERLSFIKSTSGKFSKSIGQFEMQVSNAQTILDDIRVKGGLSSSKVIINHRNGQGIEPLFDKG